MQIPPYFYKHQKEAFNKLSNLKVGILSMDMGTGKTILALELFLDKQRRGYVDKLAYIAPASAISNIHAEIDKFKIYSNNINLFSVEGIGSSNKIYQTILDYIDNRTMIIVDESIKIKNPIAKRTIRLLNLANKTNYKMILTGTLITKYVKDLWSQVHFLSPLILGYNSFWQFRENHLEYDKLTGRIYNSFNIDWLTQKLSPYIYECKIDDVLDMPKTSSRLEKFSMCYSTELKYVDRQYFWLEKIGSYDGNDPVNLIFGMFRELREISFTDESRREILRKIIREMKDKYLIIWVNLTKEIELIKEIIPNAYVFNGKKKEHSLWKKSGGVLIANLQTGSLSHNFQFCKKAIYYSQSWDYVTKVQSERRIWRAGQKYDVEYICLKSNAGIDSLIFECLGKKENLLQEFRELSKRYNKEYLVKFLQSKLSVSKK